MNGELWGVLIGASGMGALTFVCFLVVRLVSRADREREIQARLNRALNSIRDKENILQQEISHSSKVESDLQFTRQICGATIEQTLAYFEQTQAIFGDKKREKIIAELHQTLAYTGKQRTEPIALLSHILTNGGDHEQQLT
jgi:hypothetical protein